MHPIVLYLASAITGLWGVAHLFATRGTVADFGDLKADHRRILTFDGARAAEPIENRSGDEMPHFTAAGQIT